MQLLDRVRRRLKDPANDPRGNTWTDDDLLAYLNEEQESMVAIIIEAGEDFFATFKDFDFQPNVADYPLFDGFLHLRGLTYQGGVDPQQMIESRMIEGVEGSGGIASQTESQYFYSIYGDNIEIAPTPGSPQPAAARAFYIRAPGPVLYELIASSSQADQIQFAATNAPPESDLYVGTFIDVATGTGAGQRRQISAYTSARLATVSTPFSPALDATSKIATVSAVPALFHRMLVIGTALRAKLDNGEDASGLVTLHNDVEAQLLDFIEQRTDGQRGPVPWDPDDGI